MCIQFAAICGYVCPDVCTNLGSQFGWCGLAVIVHAPALDTARRRDPAAVVGPRAHGVERTRWGAQLAFVAFIAPAHHTAGCKDAAGVDISRTHRIECARWGAGLAVVVPAPALHTARRCDAAAVFPTRTHCSPRSERARWGGGSTARIRLCPSTPQHPTSSHHRCGSNQRSH